MSLRPKELLIILFTVILPCLLLACTGGSESADRVENDSKPSVRPAKVQWGNGEYVPATIYDLSLVIDGTGETIYFTVLVKNEASDSFLEEIFYKDDFAAKTMYANPDTSEEAVVVSLNKKYLHINCHGFSMNAYPDFGRQIKEITGFDHFWINDDQAVNLFKSSLFRQIDSPQQGDIAVFQGTKHSASYVNPSNLLGTSGEEPLVEASIEGLTKSELNLGLIEANYRPTTKPFIISLR